MMACDKERESESVCVCVLIMKLEKLKMDMVSVFVNRTNRTQSLTSLYFSTNRAYMYTEHLIDF